MDLFWILVLGIVIGYLFGYKIRPNQLLQKAIREVKDKGKAVLEQGRRGVYRTVVTDAKNRTSELTVEVKELATTRSGWVKVEYLSAHYKNPAFRTRKGNALLQEMRSLFGDYVSLKDIEWYEETEKQENIRALVTSLDSALKSILERKRHGNKRPHASREQRIGSAESTGNL